MILIGSKTRYWMEKYHPHALCAIEIYGLSAFTKELMNEMEIWEKSEESKKWDENKRSSDKVFRQLTTDAHDWTHAQYR